MTSPRIFFKQLVCGLSATCPWSVSEPSVDCPRAVHGLFVGRPRPNRGISVNCPWAVRGLSVGSPQTFLAMVAREDYLKTMSVDYLRAVRGRVRGLSTGCPWASRGVFAAFPRTVHGCPRAVYGLSVGCLRGIFPMGCPWRSTEKTNNKGFVGS